MLFRGHNPDDFEDFPEVDEERFHDEYMDIDAYDDLEHIR